MKVKLYNKDLQRIWDDFIKSSKNGTFLFLRDFMDYHQDRFQDYSLLIYSENRFVAALPAHIEGEILFTHMGLSYGGLIMSAEITAIEVIEAFEVIIRELRKKGIKEIQYKAIPHIYHRIPAEEDLYALYRLDAKLISRQISSSISYPSVPTYSRTRQRGLKKAEKAQLYIKDSQDWNNFWSILSSNLKENYKTLPVHRLEEITLLSSRFPENIKLYGVYTAQDEMLGGSVVFITDTVVHLQYTATNEFGKNSGAIDLLVHHIINEYQGTKKFFDYGISTEKGGTYLNEGLIYQKEGFGARAIVYDTYSIKI